VRKGPACARQQAAQAGRRSSRGGVNAPPEQTIKLLCALSHQCRGHSCDATGATAAAPLPQHCPRHPALVCRRIVESGMRGGRNAQQLLPCFLAAAAQTGSSRQYQICTGASGTQPGKPHASQSTRGNMSTQCTSMYIVELMRYMGRRRVKMTWPAAAQAAVNAGLQRGTYPSSA
jgi:hypothetical protein